MKRYYSDGRRWYIAQLPPGVHPLDHDAGEHCAWSECEPPWFARPPAADNDRPWRDPLVERVVGVMGVRWPALTSLVAVLAVLAGWALESALLGRWVGPRWRLRS